MEQSLFLEKSRKCFFKQNDFFIPHIIRFPGQPYFVHALKKLNVFEIVF